MSWSIQSAGLAGEALEAAEKQLVQQVSSVSAPVEREHARDVFALLSKVLSSIPQKSAVTVEASGHVSDGQYTLKVSVTPKTVSVTAIGKAPAK